MSQVDVWTPIGPEEVSGIGVGAGGVLGSIAIDGQTIYVGSGSCGVWRRYASSGSWNPVSDQLPTLGVAALAVDPARSGRVFAALIGNGIYLSDDSGASWQFQGSPAMGQPVDPYRTDLLVQNKVLHMITAQGIFRSEILGVTWALTKKGVATSLVRHPKA